MAWRFGKCVVRGEIDNRARGRVTGWIEVLGRSDPMRIDLKGNCLRDIAGCLVRFENGECRDEDVEGLTLYQRGVVGDITASLKVGIVPARKHGEPWDDYIDRARRTRKVGNALHLEWISDCNGRVVIEGAEFTVRISEPQWRMTRDEHRAQCDFNRAAVDEWMDDLTDRFGYPGEDIDDDDEMDEFEWEQYLREADERADRYVELMERYLDHPDGDRLIAREMGWNRLEEVSDEDSCIDAASLIFDETAELSPNPTSEGIDWIRDSDGQLTHPLTARLHDLTLAIWRHCKELGVLHDPADRDVHDMMFQLHTASAKVAGALDGLAYDEEPQDGFIVACLKRSLVFLHNGIAAMKKVSDKDLLDPATVKKYRSSLFIVREEILRLMNRFRQRRF